MAYAPDVSAHTTLAPNGAIYVYEDVPFDSDYTHSLNRAVQGNADLQTVINGYLKHTLTAQSYSRLTENSVRIQRSKEELKHCNYLAITNGAYYVAGATNALTANENMVFYAFITEVEYVNNITSDVYFEIDYLQTYWHCFTIPANFIEREHCLVANDVLGFNMLKENLETGELICHDKQDYNFTPRDLIICYSPNWSDGDSLPQFVAWDSAESKYDVVTYLDNAQVEEQFAPQIKTGIIGAQAYLRINGGALTTKEMMGRLMSATIAIAKGGCKTISVQFVAGEIVDSMWGNSASTFNKWIDLQTDFKSLDGSETFTPKNAKTLQFPFCQILMTNNNGSTETYHPELFRSANNQVNFGGKMYINPNAYAYMYPFNYRGLGEDKENGVGLDYFPQIPFSEDSYAQWWAKSKDSFLLGIGAQVASTAIMASGAGGMVKTASEISSMTANIDNVGNKGFSSEIGVSSASLSQHRDISMNKSIQSESKSGGRRGMSLGFGVLGIARSLAQMSEARNAPDSLTMSNGNGNLQVIQGRCGFSFYKMSVTIEMAKIIDKYFDMFGYATNKVKVPNFLANPRSIWDYVKMDNCFIKAQTGQRGLPENAQKAIQAIFNNGITLWGNVAQVGNYNLDNHSQHA